MSYIQYGGRWGSEARGLSTPVHTCAYLCIPVHTLYTPFLRGVHTFYGSTVRYFGKKQGVHTFLKKTKTFFEIWGCAYLYILLLYNKYFTKKGMYRYVQWVNTAQQSRKMCAYLCKKGMHKVCTNGKGMHKNTFHTVSHTTYTKPAL